MIVKYPTNSYDITTIVFFAIILIFSIFSCLKSQLDDNYYTASPVHFYSAPSYHIASPVASRYTSPTSEIDLYAPLPERYSDVKN